MTITDERRPKGRPNHEGPESGPDSGRENPGKGFLGQVVETRGGVLVGVAGERARKSFDPVWEEAKEKAAHVTYAGAAVVGTGMLGQGLSGSGTDWVPLALAAPVAGWATWRYSGGLVGKHMPYATIEHTSRVRRFIAAISTATGGWLASAAAVGVDPNTLGGKVNLTVGGLLGLWAASPYVRFRGQPPMLPPSPSRPEVEFEVEVDQVPIELPESPSGWEAEVERYAALWKKNIAVRDGALPGTSLSEDSMQEIRGGWTGTISQDVPGSFAPERWVPATGRVAAAFQIGLADITLEASSDNASKAAVTVLHDNPLVNVQNWTGPYALLGEEQVKPFDPNTGIAIVGIHSDGELVRYRFWNSGGAWHDLISGATGSGKSEFVSLLLGYERHACVEVPVLDEMTGQPKLDENGDVVKVKRGLIVSRIGDPQWGQSFTDWQDAVDWFAPNIDEIRIMLQKTEREMYARNKKFGRAKFYNEKLKVWQRGIKNFKATPDLPLISITIDEAHEVLKDPECKRIVAVLGKMGRKVGIKLRLITQVPLLQELGNDMAIRDAVASGNVIVFRTANSLSGQVAFNGALPASPNTIPREWPKGRAKPGEETTAGLGYALGASARSAIMRAFYPGDAIDWIYLKGEEGEAIGDWGTPGELDPLTRAAGHGYEDRHRRLADLDDADDAADSAPTGSRRGTGMTAAQVVLSIFQTKASDDFKIKLEDLVVAVNGEFTQRMISVVLGQFGKKGWVVSGKSGGLQHGWHQLTIKGREEAFDEMSQDNVVENPAADEQRELVGS